MLFMQPWGKTRMSLIVNEIFYSIQGESIHAGLPCIFVRLTGCNLLCTYCDTTYAYAEGEAREIHELLNIIGTYPCKRIAITGGEPLLQADTPDLISELLQSDCEVILETNGSFDISWIDSRCCRVVDVKCPGSGEQSSFNHDNLQHLDPDDQVKFVISNRDDYDFARNFLHDLPNSLPMGNRLFSPNLITLSPSELAAWILADGLDVRLHLQQHKFIWPGIERGV
jgi:7-carboxy-7-deazaguanine synthase